MKNHQQTRTHREILQEMQLQQQEGPRYVSVEELPYPVSRAPMDLQVCGGDVTLNRPVLIYVYPLLFLLQVPVLSQM